MNITSQAAPDIKQQSTDTNQRDLFDKLASSDVLYHYPQESLDKLNSLVRDKGLLLNIGCGDGIIGQALDASTTIGLDISPHCIKLSNSRGCMQL